MSISWITPSGDTTATHVRHDKAVLRQLLVGDQNSLEAGVIQGLEEGNLVVVKRAVFERFWVDNEQ